MSIKNKRTGTTGKRAIKDFQGSIKNIGKKASKQLPSTFYPTMANMIRRFFVDNYGNREGWVNSVFHGNYPARKDWMLANGDAFTIGKLGIRPVIHGSESFGRRTDSIIDNIGTKSATQVRTTITEKPRSKNITFTVGVIPDLWEGTYKHHHVGKSGKRIKGAVTTKNLLEAFSYRVSPSGEKSVFVKLTQGQLKLLAKHIRKNYRTAVNKVMQRRAA